MRIQLVLRCGYGSEIRNPQNPKNDPQKKERKRNMVKRAGHSPKNVQEFHLWRDGLLLKLGNPSRRPKKKYCTPIRDCKKVRFRYSLKNMKNFLKK
jgi:hypothetical protein